MMEKLLLLGVVLAFCSSVMAAGHVELRIAPDDVNLAGYYHSETITIQIYATGFYTDYPNDTIGFMDIAAVLTDNGGTASAPDLHDTLELGTGISAGTIVNSGGVLIEDIHGSKGGDLVGVYPFPAVLWECEFHIPDAPLSSIITISLDGLSLKSLGYNDPVPMYTVGEPLEINMACCPGGTDNDGDIDIDDFYRFLGDLSYAYYLTGLTGTAEYIITPAHPDTSFLWDPCLDTDNDVDCDIDDFYKILGDLSYAYYLTGLTGTAEYIITPTHPDTGFLWPCN